MHPFSRYRHTFAATDPDGNRYLSTRDRLLYRDRDDNRIRVCRKDERLWGVAHVEMRRVFPERPIGLWWVIGDYQPVPIHDPTLVLASGTRLVIPPDELVREFLAGRR